MAIYTKTGDKGSTGIHGGARVAKDDLRIECNGCIDELNSQIGLVRTHLTTNHYWHSSLFRIQKELMVVMSLVATPADIRHTNPNHLEVTLVCDCEKQIDNMSKEIGTSTHFLLPGGNLVSAHLHVARCFARRAERRLWTLHRVDEVPSTILVLLNRLSDLFFVMARYELFINKQDEEVWKAFAYKKRTHNK